MKTNRFAFVTILFLFATSASAQKVDDRGPVGIFQSGAEYDQFMGAAKQAAYGPNGNAELRAMIPMLNDMVLGKPVGWTAQENGVEGSTLGMLADEKIRAELDMVDTQYEELKALNEELQNRAAEQLRGLDFKDVQGVADRVRKIRSDAEAELNALLLPHQTQRLSQLRAQSQLRRRSLVEIITSEPIKTDLDISDDQAEELLEAEQEIEEELRREIAKLREEARERLLSRLNRSQRDEVKEMFGSAFDFGEEEKGKGKK